MNLRIRLSTTTPINIIAYICIIFTFTPMMRQHYLWYLIGAFLLFFLLSLPKYIHCLSHNLVMQLVSIYFLVEVLYLVVGFSDAALANYSYRAMRLIAIWMFFYFTEYSDEVVRKKAFYVLVLCLGINIVQNISKWMTSESSIEMAFLSANKELFNVGRTDFQYCVALMAMVLIAHLFAQSDFEEKRINKTIMLGLIVVSSIYIILYAQSTTMLLTTLFAVGVMFIFRKQRTRNQMLVRFMLLLFIVAIAILCLDYILQWLINIAEALGRDKTVSRLIFMQQMRDAHFSTAGSEIGSVSRIKMIGIDIRCWANNVLSVFFGRGYHFKEYGDAISSALNNFSGNHSTLFDILARYGLIGITFYLSIIRNFRVQMMNNAVSERAKAFIMVIWGYVIFNMIMNDIGFHNILFLALFMTEYLLTSNLPTAGVEVTK